MKVPTDKLVEALAADNLIKKDNYSVALKAGKLSLDGVEQNETINSKYKTLIDAFGGANMMINNKTKN